MSWLSVLASLLLLSLCVEASVHEYKAEKFTVKGNAFVVYGGSEGIHSFSPNHNHTSSAAANGDSYISFERITFRRNKHFTNFSSWPIYAIVFEVEDRETIGSSAYGGQRAVCCTSDLAKLGVCTEGQVIHHPSAENSDWPQVFGVSFDMDDEAAVLASKSIQITKTGLYNVYFIHCDTRLKELVVEGKTVWKNPSGYLPGRMAPMKIFYQFMSFAFVLLGIFWFSRYAIFWSELFPVQNCITLVITLGMFEMTLWCFDFAEFNETGIRPIGITICAVTFGTVKRTAARLIILIVSMGYGVVRVPTLGGITSKVVMLGGTFFLASEVLEMVENVVWIFTSLSATLNKLQARRMTSKLDIYRKFANALAVAVIISVGWICYEFQIYFKSNDIYNEQWRNEWIIPAFWQVLSFSLLCVICVLWAPPKNLTRYAYRDDGSDGFDRDDTTLMLIKPSILSKDFGSVPEAQSSNGTSNGDDLEVDKTV
ncbi:hypothetical protein TanjilG_13907 [Lupinus angustifolius]|uniref:GOST seven transmembrane domain-containing protein n=1 Tax=Lupinus angustifolius TaxID=3871 RepID=A0A1J7HS06_LUPAN|nr:hypothetical protein TanjilG_13907 [Lupinus angustifolius]